MQRALSYGQKSFKILKIAVMIQAFLLCKLVLITINFLFCFLFPSV